MTTDHPKKSILDLTAMAGEMLKPKELIELKNTGSLTLQDRRVFNKLIENAWGPNLGRAGHWFQIPTAELRDATDRNKRLGDSVERLMQTICVVVDEEAELIHRTALLSSNRIETNANNGTFHYKLTEELAELLKDSTIFAKLDLEVMRSFRSKYAFSLYEAIARRVRLRRFTEDLTLEELRDILGVEEGKLDTYRNLNLRAIQPALEEVNAITPYEVSILPKKKGRKVESFIMGWSVKDTDGLKQAYKELQQPKVGRRARVDGQAETIAETDKPTPSSTGQVIE
jgi:plasmid replication initiation protein